MSNYQELLKKREELDMKINEARKAERQGAINQALEIISDFNLTPKEVFGKRKPYKKPSAKYRDPATGATWTGRGREPLWIKGKSREDFAIKVEA